MISATEARTRLKTLEPIGSPVVDRAMAYLFGSIEAAVDLDLKELRLPNLTVREAARLLELGYSLKQQHKIWIINWEILC